MKETLYIFIKLMIFLYNNLIFNSESETQAVHSDKLLMQGILTSYLCWSLAAGCKFSKQFWLTVPLLQIVP